MGAGFLPALRNNFMPYFPQRKIPIFRYYKNMQKTALITGASGGLGEGFARLFAKNGHDVILVARSEDKLKALAQELEKQYSIHATAIAMDLSSPNAASQLNDQVTAKNLNVSILVNNAGFGDYGAFDKADPKRVRQMIDLNIGTLTDLTRLILPRMIENKNGRILNIASTAAFQPGPLMAVYYATKAYVLNFSLALSIECEGTGVTVTCLCPGPTRTGFESNANLGASKLFRYYTMDAETVVRIGYDACMCGRPLIVAGLINKIGTLMTRLAPRLLAARVAKKAQAPV